MGVSKNRGKHPKMDGENKGTPYFLVDDFGGKNPYFWKHPYEDLHFHLILCVWDFHGQKCVTFWDPRDVCC